MLHQPFNSTDILEVAVYLLGIQPSSYIQRTHLTQHNNPFLISSLMPFIFQLYHQATGDMFFDRRRDRRWYVQVGNIFDIACSLNSIRLRPQLNMLDDQLCLDLLWKILNLPNHWETCGIRPNACFTSCLTFSPLQQIDKHWTKCKARGTRNCYAGILRKQKVQEEFSRSESEERSQTKTLVVHSLPILPDSLQHKV